MRILLRDSARTGKDEGGINKRGDRACKGVGEKKRNKVKEEGERRQISEGGRRARDGKEP